MSDMLNLNDADFSGLLSSTVMTLKASADADAAAEKALISVATACVNRVLFGAQLDRLEIACRAFLPFPKGFVSFNRLVSLYAGGFLEEDGKYLDVRGSDDHIKIVKIDSKSGLPEWVHKPKSSVGKILLKECRDRWEKINKKTQGLVFNKPKNEKPITYADILKTLKRLNNSKKWASQDIAPISALFKKLAAELAE